MRTLSPPSNFKSFMPNARETTVKSRGWFTVQRRRFVMRVGEVLCSRLGI